MYKEIEDLYKKEGYYNVRIRWISILYLILYIILIGICAMLKFDLLSTIIALFVYIVIIIVIIMICLDIKLSFNINKIKQSIIKNMINRQTEEINMLKKLLKNNNKYNLKTIEQIIEHYRSLSLNIKEKNIWNMISIVLTIVMAASQENIIFNSIISVIFCIICYFFITSLLDYIKTLRGEDGIYERLEEIFTEIYSELTYDEEKEKIVKNKKIKKIKNSKK